MSELSEKLARPEQSAGKARATEEQISRMSGIASVSERDGRGRAMTIERKRWLMDGSLGEAEVWKRVDKELFERM